MYVGIFFFFFFAKEYHALVPILQWSNSYLSWFSLKESEL
jgi:hypothetical protein